MEPINTPQGITERDAIRDALAHQANAEEFPSSWNDFVDPESGIEKIKLTKNTKGYNWEIKLVGKPEDQLARLKKLNQELRDTYG